MKKIRGIRVPMGNLDVSYVLKFTSLVGPKKGTRKTIYSRGGQKTVKPDLPDPLARPLAYIRTDTDTDILNIRRTDG